METLVVVSKVKKYIKATGELSTAGDFAEKLSELIHASCLKAIETAKENKRKTVMGRDFSFFTEDTNVEEVLTVSSKVKQMIKNESGLSCSAQVPAVLTYYVQQVCKQAIENAKADKRKTAMAKDIHSENN